MSDESSHTNFEIKRRRDLIQLGYLVQNQYTHPFSLSFQDLTNLLVLGTRAEDIYYNLLIQLCDDHRKPVLVFIGNDSSGYEEQVCEGPLWYIDLTTDEITFNTLTLGEGLHPSRQISILISLFEDFLPLSATARNLLHVIIWKTLLSASNPTFQHLQNILPFYKHYDAAYLEIRRLLEALPYELLETNYDNLQLSRIKHLSTIISGNNLPVNRFALNMLLLKLVAEENENLPPLFLVNTPSLNPQLFQWLCARYAVAKRPLVVFDTQNKISTPSGQHMYNFIFTDSPHSDAFLPDIQLTESERAIMNKNNDFVAVRLRSEPATRIITIF